MEIKEEKHRKITIVLDNDDEIALLKVIAAMGWEYYIKIDPVEQDMYVGMGGLMVHKEALTQLFRTIYEL